jgi:hypothetical protein
MAELPVPHWLKPGHRFEYGPYLLDLYRLLSMELADERVVNLGETEFPAIERLRGEFVEGECIRILTSTSIALRILFDQRDERLAGGRDEELDEFKNGHCGRLYANWSKVKESEGLTLREACNKIIHATKINRDVADTDPGRKPSYYQPFLYLYGKKDDRDWRVELSIVHFVGLVTPVFLSSY